MYKRDIPFKESGNVSFAHLKGIKRKINTSMAVLPLNTRSLSMPQDRHSVFLLP